MSWVEKEKEYIAQGFDQKQIQEYRDRKYNEYIDGGVDKKAVDEYFGIKTPDEKILADKFKSHLENYKPTEASGILDAIDAGWQVSSSALLAKAYKGQNINPDTVVPEHAPTYMKVAQGIATVAGDTPAMIAGYIGGKAIAGPLGALTGNPVVAGIAAEVGGQVGANAAPEFIRTALMEYYNKGEMTTASEFGDFASTVFLKTAKAGAVGAVTFGAGQVAGKLAPTALSSVARTGSEIVTMTTVSKALEGELPNFEDFTTSAAIIGTISAIGSGVNYSPKVVSKLQKIYAKTGKLPADIVAETSVDPILKQQILSENDAVPQYGIEQTKIEVPIEQKTIFHGTNTKFDKLDYDRGGGMVHFAETREVADRYAMGAGGGRRTITDSEMAIWDTSKSEKDGPYVLKDGAWTQEKTGKTISQDKMKADLESGNSSMQIEPANKIIIEQKVDMTKVVDTRTNVGLSKLLDALTPTNSLIKDLIQNAKRDVGDTDRVDGRKGFNFGGEFWSRTQWASKNETIRSHLKEFSKQLTNAGYEGIRFADDSHSTIAIFDPTTKPKEFVQSPNLARIQSQPEVSQPKITSDRLYTYFVDKLYPIKSELKNIGADTKADKVYDLFRMIPDSKAKVKAFIEKGSLSFTDLSYNGKSFMDIIKPFDKDAGGINGFKDYLISSRVLELDQRGIKHGFDSEYSKNYVKENSAKYQESAKQFYDYNNRMIDYLVDSEVLTPEAAKTITDTNKAYVSLSRIIDDTGSGKSKGGKLIKSIKGSERAIQDPFLSMVENFEMYMKAAEKNRAMLSLVKAVESMGEDAPYEVLSKEATPVKGIEIKSKEVEKYFKDNGINADPEPFTVFRSADRDLGKNQIQVFRKGKREIWTINDDLLAESLKSLDFAPQSLNPVLQMMGSITKIKKIGISITPEFISRNFFRDQVTSGIFTDAEAISLKDTVVAMGDLIKKSDEYYRWLKSGGANGAFMEMGERYLNNNIYKSPEMLTMRDKVINVVSKPIQWMEVAGNLAEQSTRLAEFKRVTKGADSGAMLLKGGMASREITLDFQRVGLKTQALNQIVAYLNPTIQGMDKIGRAIKADPAKFTKRAAALVTLPSVLLWYANKDDERYQEIPQWQKDYFWIIPTDDWQEASANDRWQSLPKHLIRQSGNKVEINKGIVYRIPKPQELGLVFGSIPERVLNSFYKDNKSASFQLKDTLMSAVMPNLMPDAIAPVVEQMTNKSFFSGSAIVPYNLEKVLPEHQYKEYTSETAILLGKTIGYVPFMSDIGSKDAKLSSPVVVENYIRSWTGTAGSYALQVSDQALRASGYKKTEVYPSVTAADIPVIRAFVARHPSMSADSIQRFTDFYQKQEKYQATFKLLIKRQQTDAAVSFINEHSSKMIKLDSIKQAISKQNDVIYNVFYNKTYSSDEKRQLIDSTYYQMVETAKAGLEVAGQLDKITEKLKDEGVEP